MALKSYNPTTPGQRGLVLIDRSELWKGRPVKSLTEGLTSKGGRNNTGRITMWHKGGGAKRLYRIVDFRRTKFDVPATVERIEYDPNRTAFIALISYEDGERAYIIAPQRLAVGDKVIARGELTADGSAEDRLCVRILPAPGAARRIDCTRVGILRSGYSLLPPTSRASISAVLTCAFIRRASSRRSCRRLEPRSQALATPPAMPMIGKTSHQ